MRSYIHIHLCVSLSISQLVFVAGVTPVGEGGVSPGCRVVAVLLHYFFLASFMWVLMEGVVLYVELLRAFIKHTLRYITAFTLTSYGMYALYRARRYTHTNYTYRVGAKSADHYICCVQGCLWST